MRIPERVCDVEGDPVCSKNSTFGYFDETAWNPRLQYSQKVIKGQHFSRQHKMAHELQSPLQVNLKRTFERVMDSDFTSWKRYAKIESKSKHGSKES